MSKPGAPGGRELPSVVGTGVPDRTGSNGSTSDHSSSDTIRGRHGRVPVFLGSLTRPVSSGVPMPITPPRPRHHRLSLIAVVSAKAARPDSSRAAGILKGEQET